MKNRLRFLAILIALFMCVNMLPIAAFAAEGDYIVTYKVVNGTWAEGGTTDITEEVAPYGSPAQIPIGMKAGSGYEGGAWSPDPSGATITENTTFTYTFSAIPTKYTVTYKVVNGTWADGGTTEITEEVLANGNPAQIPTGMKAGSGYEGGAWSPDPNGATITADTTYTYTFTASQTTAYNVTIAESITNGTVDSNKATAAAGETVTLSITPAKNYVLESLNITDDSNTAVGLQSLYSFIMPESNVTITATFKQAAADTYTVNVTNDGNGTASASPVSGEQGTEVTLSATPSEGYKFKEWTVSAGGVTITGNKFTIGTANVEVKAVFEKIEYEIAVEGTTHGTVTVPQTATKDTVVTINLTPDPGYELNTLSVEDSGGKAVSVSDNKFTMPASKVYVKASFKESTVVPVTYTITAGANGYWVKGSGLPYSITVKRSVDDKNCASYFQAVFIDMNVLSPFDYTVRSGSAIVTINASTMQRQTVGTHTITILFKDGFVSTFTYVWADPRYPATGDERQTATWAVLSGATFVGMSAIAVLGSMYWKKKKKEKE